MDESAELHQPPPFHADPFYAFLDNLVRAATGTRHVAVVLSLPKSAVEMTQYEHGWQDRITKIVKRVARDLIANDESEVSEVVRAACSRTLAPSAFATRWRRPMPTGASNAAPSYRRNGPQVDPTLSRTSRARGGVA